MRVQCHLKSLFFQRGSSRLKLVDYISPLDPRKLSNTPAGIPRNDPHFLKTILRTKTPHFKGGNRLNYQLLFRKNEPTIDIDKDTSGSLKVPNLLGLLSSI